MRKIWKRTLALILSAVLIFSTYGMPTYATDQEKENFSDYPLHVHDETCGYSEGTPCNHEHTEECYTLVTQCVHEHTAECYSDGLLPAEGEEKEADACTHVCSEESGCITKELNCQHVHDESCGYSEGTPCTYEQEADSQDKNAGLSENTEPADQTVSVTVLTTGDEGAATLSTEPVTYMTWNENKKQSVSAICTAYYALSGITSTTWGTAGEASWYVLDADVTFDERITLQGDVRLILKDGYTLTANGGIWTKDDSSLTIYGQSGDSGKLIASATDGNAGIGSDSGTKDSADITICGGTVEATGGADAAGIGTGREGRISEITIYGGIIKAVGGTDAAGIGTGLAGIVSYITLAGGTIEAAHGEVLKQEASSASSDTDSPYDVGPGWKGTMKALMTFTAGHEGIGGDGTDDTETGSSSQGERWYRYVVDICGGSLCTTGGEVAYTTREPYNSHYGDLTKTSKAVYCTVADLGAENANQPVSGTITVDGEEYLYNFNGVRTDAYGKLYLYLFAGEAVLTVNGFKFAGTIDADNQTLQPVLGGSIYFNEATPYQDQLTVNIDSVTPASCQESLTYTWYRCDDKTGAGATLIEGAAGSTYTLTEADQGKYIKVEVSAPGYEAYPLTTVSHQVDSSVTSTILRITGVTLGAKTYDGTGDFDVQDVAFDVATLTKDTDYTATATLTSGNYAVGGNKTVTVTVTLLNENYTFEENQTAATYRLTNQVVTPATLTVASAAAVSRSVNGTSTVNITGVTLGGVVEGEDVAVATTGLTGELSGSEAGTYETVTLSQTLTLTGADADNYLLTQPTGAVMLDPSVTLWVRDGTVVQIDGVYQIETEDDLFWFAELVNGTLTDGTPQDIAASAVLTGDITITAGRTWTPIGNKSAGTSQYYKGTFDGQGFTIDGMVVNNPDSNYQGFVGYLSTGTIKNLTLGGNCSVTGYQDTGGICGYFSSGTTENCTFNGTVTGNYRYTGGICGYIYKGAIQNCTNNGLVECNSSSEGGICGWNYFADISECINNASVTGTSSYVGGICGSNRGTITNCINNGKITGLNYVGGIVGYCGSGTTTGTVSSCINKGSLSGSYRGGICGWNKGNITNCYWLNAAYSGSGIGTNQGTSASVASKISSQFASGEVTWLLNNSTSEGDLAWHQNLDNGKTADAYPVLDNTHGVVYAATNCLGTASAYSNTPLAGTDHQYSADGFCTVCGAYQPAVLKNEVYQISNAGQLFWFAALVNGDTDIIGTDVEKNAAASAVLTADITIPYNMAWTPMGSEATPYTGTFDGNGYTIENLKIDNAGDQYQGFVGYLGTGTVKNLTLGETCSVTGGKYSGGICGWNNEGTISGCTNRGSVSGNGDVGGICGHNMGPVENCENTGTVTGSAKTLGGICGYSKEHMTSCTNSGTINGGTNQYVGGICGYTDAGAVTGCANSGVVTGGSYTGGVCGFSDKAITNCWNSGSVTGTTDVGGICGRNHSQNGVIADNYNCGTVTGSTNVGSICGNNLNTALEAVTNCYWLEGTASKGISSGSGTATSKTSEDFTSGEVAYLLNGSTNENVTWYQNLDNGKEKDNYPVLDSTHGMVYCIEEEPVRYSNYPDGEPAQIISVDITWGDLSFTYSEGTWNANTHTYEGSGWTADSENGNTVTIENTGNTPVTVFYDYNEVETGITGSFTEGETPVSVPLALPAGNSSTVCLILTGKPENELNNATIGRVTVTIGGDSQ